MQMMMGGRRGRHGDERLRRRRSSYGGMMQMMMGGGMGGMGGMMGGGAGAASPQQGTDKRSVDRGKKREEEIKAAERQGALPLRPLFQHRRGQDLRPGPFLQPAS